MSHCLSTAHDYNRPSLHMAALVGDVSALNTLIERRVPIDAVTKNRYTALHIATQKNRIDVALRLLQAGANCNLHDAIYEETPLLLAARLGHLTIMTSLLDYAADPQRLDKMGNTALHCCALYMKCFSPEYQEVVSKLLKHNVDINARNQAGETTLHIAVQRYPQLAHYLLQKGADPNIPDQRGCTPLNRPNIDTAAIPLLLSYHADPTLQDDTGTCALHRYIDSPYLLQQLCQKAATINVMDHNGDTPLHLAIRAYEPSKPSASLIELSICSLLQYHPDLILTNRKGVTSYQEACALGYSQVINPLTAHLAKLLRYVSTPSQVAATREPSKKRHATTSTRSVLEQEVDNKRYKNMPEEGSSHSPFEVPNDPIDELLLYDFNFSYALDATKEGEMDSDHSMEAHGS